MRFLKSLLIVALLTASASAQQWYARGDFNGWSTDNPMILQSGNHYTATITGLFDNVGYPYKIGTADWATAMPASNGRVYTDANGEIKFHLWDQTTWNDGWSPNNARRVGYDDPQQFGWEVVGGFNSWPSAADPAFALTSMGSGLYSGTFALQKGIYDFKFRGLTATEWDTSIGNDFGNGAGNNSIAVAADGDPWTFELDLPNGRWRAFTTAAPAGTTGDYNSNGIVDAADYTVWRDHLGSSQVLPNDPVGGTIGTQQFNNWKANFGQGAVTSWLVRSTQGGDQTMVSVGGGNYQYTYTGLVPSSDNDFRVVKSDLSQSVPGSDIKIRANAAGEVTVNLYTLASGTWSDGWSPSNVSRVGYVDAAEFGWEIVGGFNSWPGANDPAYALTSQGNGLYTGAFTFDTPGTYQFKFRHLDAVNPWSTSIGDDFGNSAANNSFTVTNAGELWHFELDLLNGRWRSYLGGAGSLSAVPEPSSLVLMLVGLCSIVARRRK